jgi:hypothetical protein
VGRGGGFGDQGVWREVAIGWEWEETARKMILRMIMAVRCIFAD